MPTAAALYIFVCSVASPADGTDAAFKNQDFGMSSGSSKKQATPH